MTIRLRFRTRTLAAVVACWCSGIAVGMWTTPVSAQAEEPIAYIGHGAFFDTMGNEIPLTPAFVEKAQAWYRNEMVSALSDPQKRDFAALEQRLYEGVPAHRQARLIAQQRALEWLIANSPKHKNDDRMLGKVRALQSVLPQLPE